MKCSFPCAKSHRLTPLLFAALLLVENLLAADSFPEFSKLPAQPALPDPLMMLNGERVATPEQWVEQRRPELKALFHLYMYGSMPPAPSHLDFTVDRIDNHFFGDKATEKEVTISFDAATNA